MQTGLLYFYTATILNWQNLFTTNEYRKVVMNSLKHLNDKQLMIVYGFVIMPNHIHLLIEIPPNIVSPNKVQHSFMSFTGHEFKKIMKNKEQDRLSCFLVSAKDRAFQFWERNPKIIPISDFNMAGDVVNYMHCNPLQSKWNLVESPEKYSYSSASYYQDGIDNFDLLNHYMDFFNQKVLL